MPLEYGPPIVIRGKVALLGGPKTGKTALREAVCCQNFPKAYSKNFEPEVGVKQFQVMQRLNITRYQNTTAWWNSICTTTPGEKLYIVLKKF